MEYSPNKMKQNLNDKQFNFKKKFGQNFIIDENTIDKIVTLSDIDKETMVIEIGPGAGSLTYKLGLNAQNVLCYEIDTTIKEVLNENIKELNNIEIKYQDFLKSNVLEDIQKYNYKKLYVVANLPYYITTPIITKIIEDKIPVDKIVIMVQKEVGDRFKATVGSKDYNSLSIYLNYYFDVRQLMKVSKTIFIPQPKVDSIVVEFIKKEQLQEVNNLDLFFKLVRDSFKQKRKTLKNNLKNYDLKKIEEELIKYDMDLSIRAEQIPMEVFIALANKLEE